MRGSTAALGALVRGRMGGWGFAGISLGLALTLGDSAMGRELFPGLATQDPAGNTTTVRMRIRASDTRAALPATITVRAYSVEEDEANRELVGTAAVSLQPGWTAGSLAPGLVYLFSVESPGYKPLSSWFQLGPGDVFSNEVLLDPVAQTPYLTAEALSSAKPEGTAVLHGFVYDASSSAPLAGAVVSLEASGVQVHADDKGYYRLFYPQPESRLPGDIPPFDDLTFVSPGYGTHREMTVPLDGDDMFFPMDLVAGGGATQHAATTADDLERLKETLAHDQPAVSAPETEAQILAPLPPAPELWQMSPPSSIRVATSSPPTCTITTLTLERYVETGLDDEWGTGTLPGHALRAGAIAYRAFGAYYVQHPRSSCYDICSDVNCQKWGAASYTARIQAAQATAGIMLQASGSIFFAEQTTEGNRDHCSDGFTGSPDWGWPCMTDAVCAGKTPLGHGRGMCHQGAIRWAQNRAKNWVWITNHYYNDNYNENGSGTGLRIATMTTPLRLSTGSVSATPTSVNFNDTLTISANANNVAGSEHNRVFLTAQLCSGGACYRDSSNDKKIVLAAGATNVAVTRRFTVPYNTPGGVYDLEVSLYYDVNGDNLVGGTDLLLDKVTLPTAITVVNNIVALVPSAPVAGTVSSPIFYGDWQYYSLDVPADTKIWSVNLTGLSANADLYYHEIAPPTASAFEIRSMNPGTSNEQILGDLAGRHYYGVVNAATSGSISYTISATITPWPSISGRVTVNGVALAGATVHAYGPVSLTATTDASGNYVLPHLFDGTYSLWVTKNGVSMCPAWTQSVLVQGLSVSGVDMNFTSIGNPNAPAASVAILVDESSSLGQQAFNDEIAAAKSLVTLLPSNAAIAAYVFDGSVRQIASFTTNKSTVTNALSSVIYNGGNTALYNAIYTASSNLGALAAPRYAVVMTDGKNNVTGGRTKTDAINRANLYNVDAYTVGFGPGIDAVVLRDIATQTGGAYYEGTDSRALDLIAGQIAATLTCR
ncbi:MAG: VWA domain-containing protein [Acidobacteria bacterium]|nr:VWA domain-containing protein [Acidobacteriota bacterium]